MCGLAVLTLCLLQYVDFAHICVGDCRSQSNLVKLLQIHLSVTVQIKHLEGNLKVPLGSWTQKHIQKSIQHHMKTSCHIESTQTTAKEFNTESVSYTSIVQYLQLSSWTPVVEHGTV